MWGPRTQKHFTTNKQVMQHNFVLSDLNGNHIKNSTYETDEQLGLGRVVKEGDIVLNLGGNIGTSCIYASKLKAHVKCVEPISELASLIRENVNANRDDGDGQVDVIHGMITKSVEPMYIRCNSDDGRNCVGATTSNKECDPTETGCSKVTNDSGVGWIENTNVLFSDCEGCLPAFIREYGSQLGNVEAVVYERDQGDDRETPVDYSPVDQFLKENNFVCDGNGFHETCVRRV